jgi:hypothetical protein
MVYLDMLKQASLMGEGDGGSEVGGEKSASLITHSLTQSHTHSHTHSLSLD